MPMPQVTERVKDAPAIALRAIFAGIGQLLLAADKFRTRVMEQMSPPEQPERARPTAAPTAPEPPRPPLGETGNVRVIREEPGAVNHAAERRAADWAEPEPAPGPSTAAGPAPAAAPPAEPPAEPTAVPPPAEAAAAPAAPPIANYDDLSLASLRARLRVLDAATLQAMLDYERAHASREAVVAMFERRLAKLEDTAG